MVLPVNSINGYFQKQKSSQVFHKPFLPILSVHNAKNKKHPTDCFLRGCFLSYEKGKSIDIYWSFLYLSLQMILPLLRS